MGLARTANMRWHGRSRETERGSVVSARRTTTRQGLLAEERALSHRLRPWVGPSCSRRSRGKLSAPLSKPTSSSERDPNPFSRSSSSCVVIEAMRKETKQLPAVAAAFSACDVYAAAFVLRPAAVVFLLGLFNVARARLSIAFFFLSSAYNKPADRRAVSRGPDESATFLGLRARIGELVFRGPLLDRRSSGGEEVLALEERG